MALKHKTIPLGTDKPGFAGVTPSLYAEEHLFSGGAQGSVLVRNTLNSDGSSWIATAAGFILSTGVATLPSFTSSIPFTITTQAIAAALNNTYDFGASGTKFKDGYFAGTLTAGTFSGSGASLTSIPAANVTGSHTLPDGVLSTNVPLLNAVNTFTAFGTHTFSSGGVGGNVLAIRNTTAGTGNGSSMRVGNDANASLLNMEAYSSTFTSTSSMFANGAAVYSAGVGGLTLMATSGSGDVRIFSRAALAVTFGAAGAATFAGTVSATSGGTIGTMIFPSGSSASIPDAALGAGQTGPSIQIGANITTTGAAGTLRLNNKNGTGYFLWVDATGTLRISTSAPIQGGVPTDTSGTVVGTQT